MPDENQSPQEHAILREISEPLARRPDDATVSVGEPDFPVVLRGYDRIAVDAYVRRTADLVAGLQATRSPETAVRRALERVGDEVSGILQRAHDTAAEITASSRTEAEDRLEQARIEAREITAAAERRVKELDAETDRIWAERQRIVEDAQQLAQQLLGLAGSAAERFPAEDTGETAVAPAGLETAPMDESELPDGGTTFAAPHPGELTSPTVAFPVPFGAEQPVGEPSGEAAGEVADPEAAATSGASGTSDGSAPGAVPARPRAEDDPIGELSHEPSGEPPTGEPPVRG